MPSPTESESSAESTAGCSATTSHSCTYTQHDGSHAHTRNRGGPSESLCCGHGSRRPGGSSRRRPARAVTTFIHVSPPHSLGSRMTLLLIRWRRCVPRMPFLHSAVGGQACKRCGAQNNAFRSTCATETVLRLSSVFVGFFLFCAIETERKKGGTPSIMLFFLYLINHASSSSSLSPPPEICVLSKLLVVALYYVLLQPTGWFLRSFVYGIRLVAVDD